MRNDFNIGCDVAAEFTLGYWVDFSASPHEWWVCADENGPGGHPWTCIAPGVGYPTGWNPVTVVFPSCTSLVIGAFLAPREPSSVEEFPEEGQPVESPTWGQVQAIFGE